MSDTIPSLHILGSRQFGGADQFYVRLLRALHARGQAVAAVNRAGSPVACALADTGIEQIHVPMANKWDAWSLWRIRRLVDERQPCIVQTYMGRATRLTRLPARARAVHIARLGGYYKIDGYYRHAHAWIGNTRGICDYLVRSGMPANRVFHIGNFVPEPAGASAAELAEARRRWDVPDEARVVFALGRLIEKKGFDELLRAWAGIPATVGGRPTLLLIAGDGPRAESLRKLADELAISNRVRWLGWQDPPDVYYALADVFVCPSRHEPLGNVILEAWNHRLPVLSTRNEGALELIEEERTGVLRDIGDVSGLADGLGELLGASEAERRTLGEAGNAFLQSHFGQSAIVDAYLDLYAKLMAELGV
ncbi:glycosyltransferase [Methylococcus sp. EFPC2]|uniref:glycosyltransferase n=1 Tax=Methylococcus sp. EFPC2 TaxID=2812648 RepID=UPI0019680ED5|nr:glycosyltransferase [Methylococcus sp. EFPC2]QSA96245.1 glycosyltransferase [Methylococcus sp. EFPC2]